MSWSTATVLKTMSLWLSILASKSPVSDTLLYQTYPRMPVQSKMLFAYKQTHCCFISAEPEIMSWHLGLIVDGHNNSSKARGQET